MTRERLTLYDTTLRDGQQTQGVQFSTPEKHQIAAMLDELGLDYIEGWLARCKPHRQRVFRGQAADKAPC
jgi:2-isopropylmalate synthase